MAVDQNTPTVVILRALGLGDALTAVPALRALQRVCPGHHRVLLGPAEHGELVGHLVDEVVDVRELETPLPETVHGADLAVNLHGRGPQSHALLLGAHPRRLVGFTGPGVPYGPDWRADEHEVHRWCRMLNGHGIPAEPRDLSLEPPPLDDVPSHVHGSTLLHPGAKDVARRWPADRWAQVARSEDHAGRTVVVTAGPGEERLARSVAGLAGLGEDAVLSDCSLSELAAFVAAAGRVACGDTGVAHMATAFGTPSVVLFGPTAPAQWGPPPELAGAHISLWVGERGDPHGTVPHAGLLRIRPRDVLRALWRLPAHVEAQPPPAHSRA
jgi:ADP-heptose:LPS heptosyltransferase